ncbi:hypothetical protein [Erythrobacter sp.]|uniref:hypothetical protein n=1 Tax=Erythrobacter sp. TaxID=1042 RepID=UPI0025D3BEB9|nr:hypothetical protein [Erythrobacter sp.]
MNKHEAAIALALIKVNRPWLAVLFALMAKLPWRSFIGFGSVTALGASVSWHDVERVLALLC